MDGVSTISDQVCGSLRYEAEEIRRDTSQPMMRGKRLKEVADTIERSDDVQEHLTLADPWMVNTSFDLLGAALTLLEPVLDSDDTDVVTALLGLWARRVERAAEDANQSEHGWGEPV
jgi:hypothetical protein